MRAYHLMTLSAKKVLEKTRVVRQEDGKHCAVFRFDFSEKGRGLPDKDIILSVDSCSDNALFHQIRQCLQTSETSAALPENVANEDEISDCLRRSLVFLDFGGVSFRPEDDKLQKRYRDLSERELLSTQGQRARLQWLFDPNGGIELTFDDGVPRRFVPFDKSGSMARAERISFIDRTLLEALERRLLLDIDFPDIKLIPSKYYAYRGLYLSTGYRIEQEGEFRLDAESVLVLQDLSESSEAVKIFSQIGDPPQDAKTLWQFGADEKKQAVRVNPFDGEGLICPAYARHISDTLKSRHGFERDSHSFQIRMPFTKGMLHEVDFARFFAEFFGEGALYVTDAFGVRRDLRRAKILLTKSMFKCCGWLRQYWKRLNGTAPAGAEPQEGTARHDPMRYFFQKLQEYSHALYVSGTDARLSGKKRVQLNYQFLSTLYIDYEDFLQLIERQHKAIRRLQDAPAEEDGLSSLLAEEDAASPLADDAEELFLPEDEAAESAAEEDSLPEKAAFGSGDLPREDVRNKYRAVLKRNPAFLSDTEVRNFVRETVRTLEKNLCLGKLSVRGENRYLSGDLLFLLFSLLQGADDLPPGKSTELRKLSDSLCLSPDKFYMPQEEAQEDEASCCAFLRSPHLSRNEQCLLIPHKEADGPYERYLSHLGGVVMTAKNSFVPMALGGADFDGDIVKVIREKMVVEAVKRKVYQEEHGAYRRELPVIRIPAVESHAVQAPKSVPFETIANTFSSRIGQISNIAAQIANREYWSTQESAQAFRDKCAECTIVTGLEIDAAKTGLHPNANIRALEACVKDEKSLFLQLKAAGGKIYAGHAEPQSIPGKAPNTLSLVLGKKKTPLLSDIPLYDPEADVANIERLPGEYLRYLTEKQQTSPREKTTARDGILFRFQSEGAASTPPDKEKTKRARRLSQAYIALGKLDYRLKRSRAFYENSDYAERVGFLLKLQYDSRQAPLSCGVPVEEAQRQAYAALDGAFASEAEVRDALVRLLDEKWQFVREGQREETIVRILGLGDEETLPQAVTELLSNFRCNGYMILYYILKDIRRRFREDMDIDTYMNEAENKAKENPSFIPKNNPYWEELYQAYCEASAEKEAASVWRRKVQHLCRRHLRALFDGDMDAALCAAYEKSKSRFLWDVFREAEILRNVCSPTAKNAGEEAARKGGGNDAR